VCAPAARLDVAKSRTQEAKPVMDAVFDDSTNEYGGATGTSSM